MSSSSILSECAICLDDKTGFIAKLNCGHTYHYYCVQNWIRQKNNIKKCCCICEADTEIVQLIEDNSLPIDDNSLHIHHEKKKCLRCFIL